MTYFCQSGNDSDTFFQFNKQHWMGILVTRNLWVMHHNKRMNNPFSR
ncbi:protein of unknown function [Denitratisoma oestradiolicum]|uniref:Uncharacterized protein n=1 Tax=Denitratisoma oestradiolicum TaxID=311182 RepID=A0A6S6XQY4_9PROT|nr:protein of unknown function [Denitratisoma oestradiolicum]